MKIWLVLALTSYFTGSAGYLGYLVRHRETWHRVGHGFFILGLVIHTVFLLQAFAVLKYLPVDNLGSTLSFAAWALAVVYVLFHFRYRLMILGSFVGPLVCVALMISLGLPDKPVAKPEVLQSVWMVFHITMAFLGDGAFILAGVVGGIYLLQERAIKTKNHGFIFRRMPPLDVLDRMGYALVAFGFPLLTLGLITGFIYAKSVWHQWWSANPKEVWSLITWFLYAALLHERLAAGWRGRRAAIMAIVALAILLFTFLGVNMLLEGHHGQFTEY